MPRKRVVDFASTKPFRTEKEIRQDQIAMLDWIKKHGKTVVKSEDSYLVMTNTKTGATRRKRLPKG